MIHIPLLWVDGSKVSVGWNAPLGDDGGEQLVVNMYSGEKVVDSKIIKGSNSKGILQQQATILSRLFYQDLEKKIKRVMKLRQKDLFFL